MPASTLGNHQNITYLANTGSTQPAAAADAVLTVPANQVWRFINFHFQFATSSTVATRSAAIQVLDAAGNPVTEIGPGGVTQAASLTNIYNYQVGANSVGSQGNIGTSGTPGTVVGSLPSEFYLLAGWQIRTKIASLSASDQLTNVSAFVEIFTV
jgi:hypothetical protein